MTDGVHSFAINNYQDDGINWSSVQPDGRGNGLTGTPAQAGFNDGYNIDYFLIPGSNTQDIINISSTSNVGIPGKWIFRFTCMFNVLHKYPNFICDHVCICKSVIKIVVAIVTDHQCQ